MKRKEYEKKLAQWEAEGYNVSELREKWFPTKKNRRGSILKWLAISIVVIALAVVIIGWQLQKTPASAPAPEPTQTPAPTSLPKPEPEPTRPHLMPFNYMTYLGMSTKGAIFQDWRVRYAVYLALDRNFSGILSPDNYNQIIHKVVSIATPEVPCSALQTGFNPARAKELLKEASYPDGFKITLHVPDGVELVKLPAQIIQKYLAEVGIDVEIEAWDADSFADGCRTGKFEFFLATTEVDWDITSDLLKRLFLSTSPDNFTGFSDAKFDELLKNGSFAEAENLAFGSGGMTVLPLFWHEKSVYQEPAEKQKYILSGGPSADVPIYVDDDLIVEVNGEVIFHDNDKKSGNLDPIAFPAYPEDLVHIMALDSGKVARELSSLYLHSNGKIYRITEGISNSASSELVFYDNTFQISSLPEVTAYIISGGPLALIPIDVDDDLFIEVNGKTIYQDNDGGASVLDPIKFFAMPDDKVHITAIDVGWGARNLSSLYLISDGKSYKIIDAIKQESRSGESVFFDKTFKISEITGVLTPTPTSLPASVPPETIITFPDKNLEAAVREALSKPSGKDITAADLAALKSLQSEKRDIANLKGIEYCVNLTELNLRDNRISDISTLGSLTNLAVLNLWGNQISDISALASLKNLNSLILPANQISDISALASLTRLNGLNLGHNQISDISPLASLTNLFSLALSDNDISDISALASLTYLTSLSLDGNQISDISAMTAFTKLRSTNIGRNQISDISAVANLTDLCWFAFEGNHVSDISPLVTNIGLGEGDEIYLGDNYLDLSEGSEDMENIKRLKERGVTVYWGSVKL